EMNRYLPFTLTDSVQRPSSAKPLAFGCQLIPNCPVVKLGRTKSASALRTSASFQSDAPNRATAEWMRTNTPSLSFSVDWVRRIADGGFLESIACKGAALLTESPG